MNGLAGIAIIEKKFTEAVSMYKEALEIAEEHSEEFRLDPLLNVHIHHNLVDILPQVANCLEGCHINEQQLPGIFGENSKMHSHGKRVQYVFKRRKVCKKEKIDIDAANLYYCASGLRDNTLNVDQKIDIPKASTNPFSYESLRTTCENLKGKYLSAFRLKLSAAQEDFRHLFVEVCILIFYHIVLGNKFVFLSRWELVNRFSNKVGKIFSEQYKFRNFKLTKAIFGFHICMGKKVMRKI